MNYLSPRSPDGIKEDIKRSLWYGLRVGATTGLFIASGLFLASHSNCSNSFDWKLVGALGATGSVLEAHNIQYGNLVNYFLRRNKKEEDK